MLVLLLLISLPYISADLLYEGDNCTVPATNESGLCINIYKCDYAKTLLNNKKSPKFCGFSGIFLLVCCPLRGNQTIPKVGAVSREMCEKYNNIQNRGVAIDMGSEALSKEFPHMAAVGFVNNDTKEILWLCGGSLISHYFILTAAHCVNSYTYGPAKWIRLGDLDLNDTTEDADPRDIKISQVFTHPLYKPSSHYHDIALFKLENWTHFGVYFSAACLQTETNLPVDTLEATGWGKLGTFGDASTHLMKVELKIVNHGTCAKRYARLSTRRLKSGIMHQYQICAGDDQGKDTCPGDSGGPLHYKKMGSDWILDYFVVAGITSFGNGCGGGNTVGVYTRVSSYVDWIESIVWPEKDPFDDFCYEGVCTIHPV